MLLQQGNIISSLSTCSKQSAALGSIEHASGSDPLGKDTLRKHVSNVILTNRNCVAEIVEKISRHSPAEASVVVERLRDEEPGLCSDLVEAERSRSELCLLSIEIVKDEGDLVCDIPTSIPSDEVSKRESNATCCESPMPPPKALHDKVWIRLSSTAICPPFTFFLLFSALLCFNYCCRVHTLRCSLL